MHESRSLRGLVKIALILGVVFFLSYLIFPQRYTAFISDIASQFGLIAAPQNSVVVSPILLQYSQQAEQGDFSGAITGAQQFLNNGNTQSGLDIFQAQKIINDTNRINASTSAARLLVYQAMIKTYQDASSSPLLEAWALNDVTMVLWNTGDPALVNVIAQEPTLAQFLVSTSTPQIVSSLAQFSYSLYPSSQAAYLAPTAEGNIYTNEAMAGSLASDHSPAEQSAKLDMIKWLTRGDGLYAIEQQATSSVVLGAASNPWEQISRGVLLGSLTLVDSTYAAQMHAAFQSVYKDYVNTNYPLLATPAASAMLFDSRYLYLIDPTDVASRQKDLNQFVTVVNANQTALGNLISWMNELKLVQQGKAAVSSIYGPQAWNSMQFAYQMYLADAKISPSFASFLVSQGWHVPQ
jgi:hypothetical protein